MDNQLVALIKISRTIIAQVDANILEIAKECWKRVPPNLHKLRNAHFEKPEALATMIRAVVNDHLHRQSPEFINALGHETDRNPESTRASFNLARVKECDLYLYDCGSFAELARKLEILNITWRGLLRIEIHACDDSRKDICMHLDCV